MGMSGSVEARCKVCGTTYNWHINLFPFMDAEIVGTCDDCFERKDHDIYNENIVDDSGHIPVKLGRITFNKKGFKITRIAYD